MIIFYHIHIQKKSLIINLLLKTELYFSEKYNVLIIIPEQKDPARNCKANRLYMDIIVL